MSTGWIFTIFCLVNTVWISGWYNIFKNIFDETYNLQNYFKFHVRLYFWRRVIVALRCEGLASPRGGDPTKSLSKTYLTCYFKIIKHVKICHTRVKCIKQADGNDKVSARGLKIERQRLKFNNYLVNVCETTIEQILFIAIKWQILQFNRLKFMHLSFICN